MKSKIMTLKKKQAMAGYLFLAPIIIGLIFIFIPSLYQAFIYSVNDIKMKQAGIELTYIGFKNYYQAIFVDTNTPYLLDSLKQVAIQVPVIIIFSFFIANVLNQKFKGRTLCRAIFFLPVIAAAGIIGMMEASDLVTTMYTTGGKLNSGMAAGNIYNYENLKLMLKESELNQTFVGIILGSIDGLYNVVTASGVQVLIFISGLQSISPSLYEAAQAEGANGWICFWKISFPMISPLIIVNYVYSLLDSFLSYNNTAMQYIRIYLYGNGQYSYAITLSFIYLGVIAAILLLSYLLLNRFVIYKD